MTRRRKGGGRPMDFAAVPVLVLFLAVALLGGCGGESPRLAKGEPTPSFELATLSGNRVAFPADFEGEVVAVRFWADWCPFCEGEMRAIEPVYRKHRGQKLRILAVNVRQDRATAAAFVEPLGITYEVLLDEDGAVARAYGVSGLPTTFLIDRRGRLAARILGESRPEVLDALLGGLL